MSQLMQETLLVKQCNIKTSSIDKAFNGLEAYQMTTLNKYDLILMDLNMNLMNGFESCKIIRAAKT